MSSRTAGDRGSRSRGETPPTSARLRIKVVPKASEDRIVGWTDGILKVRIAAAPERGRANAALEALLARALGVARTRVRVVAGHSSRQKVVEVEGLDQAAVSRFLGAS